MNKWNLISGKPDIKGLRKRESLWTQGNGYMGIRASFEEAYVNEHRTTLINGVFNAPFEEVSELAVLPDVTNFEIEINGERFTMISGQVGDYHASLNMRTGEFKRSLKWTSPKGGCVKLEFARIVSDARKHITAQTVKLTPLDDMNIKIATGADGKVTNTGVQHFDNPQKRAYSDGVRGMTLQTLQSGVDAAVHYKLKCSKDYADKTTIDRRSIFSNISFEAKADEAIVIEKISSYAHSRDFEYAAADTDAEKVKADGIRYLNEAAALGYDALLKESAASWESFWNNCLVEVQSNNEFIDQAVIFAQYHLHIMASRDDNRLGVGAKALSGEGYKGHSYWDTEIFLLPYYIFNNPDAARRLLEYRYKLLNTALEKAKKYEFEGAMFPWECAWMDDGEVCPEYGDLDLLTGEVRRNLMGEIEVHITAAVAYGVWEYYCATADDDFMEKYGNELIVLTAFFWASRAEKRNGRYEILGVIGPDEYKDDVDNNAYTNYMAYHNLKYAQSILAYCPDSLYKKLSENYVVEDIKKRVDEVADNLYLPKPESDGIISQFDGCKDLKEIETEQYKNNSRVEAIFEDYGFSEILKMQVFKQADLVMLFYLMAEKFDKETIRKNFEYYEKRTLHDSSLSMCIHALVAARLGMSEMADKLFYDSCCVDLGDNTNNSDAGIHSASIGGIWLALVMGYGGLKISEDGLSVDPILPEGWSEYSFFVCFKGTRIKVTVNKDGYTYERVSGDEVKVVLKQGEQKWH